MNVLVLNGSPHKSGSVAILLRSLARALEEKHHVDWVDVYDLKMAFCEGCMRCRTLGECALPKDDAHVVGRKIRESDALVVGTPTHWGNMSAPLKLLFDRNVSAFIRPGPFQTAFPVLKGRPAVIVASCGTAWPENVVFLESRGAVNAVKNILRAGGFKLFGTVVNSGTHSDPRIPPRLVKKAESIARKIAATKN